MWTCVHKHLKKPWNSHFQAVTCKSQTRQLKQELETRLHFLAPLGARISFGWSTHLTPSHALLLVSLPHTWWNVLIAPIFPFSLKWSWKARDPQLKLLSFEAIRFGVELLSLDWSKRMSINLCKWKGYPLRPHPPCVAWRFRVHSSMDQQWCNCYPWQSAQGHIETMINLSFC